MAPLQHHRAPLRHLRVSIERFSRASVAVERGDAQQPLELLAPAAGHLRREPLDAREPNRPDEEDAELEDIDNEVELEPEAEEMPDHDEVEYEDAEEVEGEEPVDYEADQEVIEEPADDSEPSEEEEEN